MPQTSNITPEHGILRSGRLHIRVQAYGLIHTRLVCNFVRSCNTSIIIYLRSGAALSLDAPRDARTGVRIPQAQRLNTTDCGARPHLDSGMVCTYRRAVMPNLPHAFRSRAAHNVNTPSSPDYRVPATRSSPPTHAACAVIAAPTPPDTSPCPTTPCLRSRAPKNDPRRPSSMHARPRHLARQQQRSTTGATTWRGVDVGWNTVAEAHTCTLPPRHGRPRPLYPPLARPRRS